MMILLLHGKEFRNLRIGWINRGSGFMGKRADNLLEMMIEFYPFGSIIRPDGSVAPILTYMDDDHPQPEAVLKVLRDLVRQ
jgi:hypothetical protein